jgi:hypothetical protein
MIASWGQDDRVGLPIQKFRPLALMVAYWIEEPESIAKMVKEPLSERGARAGAEAARLAKAATMVVLKNILTSFGYFQSVW